ncbi:MAG TPA: hypothetical protein VFX53_05090 [Pedococcus sp.]|nr:hypothetical protein [Pedococcus sp.]
MENIKTWADGFGIWHASVPLTSDPISDARRARQQIVNELTEREGPTFDPSRVHVTREKVTGHGTAIYVEKSD